MSQEPIRFIDTGGLSEYVSPVKPLPVDIQGATLSLDASGVEIKNDSGNPIPVSDAGSSLTVDATSWPLPSGAATDANQTTIIGHVDGIEGLLTTIDADTGSIDAKLPALSSGSIPVVGPLTDTELRATAVPTAPNITRNSGAIDANTQRVTLATDSPGVASLASIAGLGIPTHDFIALTYTGTNLTGVEYKSGGSGGTTEATLTLAYDGNNNLTSVTKS